MSRPKSPSERVSGDGCKAPIAARHVEMLLNGLCAVQSDCPKQLQPFFLRGNLSASRWYSVGSLQSLCETVFSISCNLQAAVFNQGRIVRVTVRPVRGSRFGSEGFTIVSDLPCMLSV